MALPLVRAEPPERVTPPVHGPRPAPRLPTSQPLPLRTRVAVALARAVTALVRLLGRDGAVIGGRVAGLLDPRALARLAAGRTVVLVTGTNGKTTTTSMIVRACGGAGVATNDRGANMPDGVLSALLDAPDAALVVTEVDESYLGEVAAATDPAVIVVLNLSRDQLDRVGEVRALAGWVGDAVAAHPRAITVALADDVLTAGVGRRATRPVWVSCPAGPAAWRGDAGVCPRCAGSVRHDRAPAGATWVCRRCGLVPPLGDWTVDGEDLEGPDGVRHPARLGLPGRVNHLNAGFAVAVAGVLGVPADVAVARLASLEQVGGRYRVVERAGARIRLLLAKNPAGWLPTLDLLGQRPPGRVVIAVNDREADGRDVSWLWDVPFEQLAGQGHRVVATGDRVADLSVRLAYAGVDHAVAPDLRGALHGAGGGAEVDVVGNYTAFGDAERMLA